MGRRGGGVCLQGCFLKKGGGRGWQKRRRINQETKKKRQKKKKQGSAGNKKWDKGSDKEKGQICYHQVRGTNWKRKKSRRQHERDQVERKNEKIQSPFKDWSEDLKALKVGKIQSYRTPPSTGVIKRTIRKENLEQAKPRETGGKPASEWRAKGSNTVVEKIWKNWEIRGIQKQQGWVDPGGVDLWGVFHKKKKKKKQKKRSWA